MYNFSLTCFCSALSIQQQEEGTSPLNAFLDKFRDRTAPACTDVGKSIRPQVDNAIQFQYSTCVLCFTCPPFVQLSFTLSPSSQYS